MQLCCLNFGKISLFMNYLSVKDLSKSFGEQKLFEGLTFGLQKGEKLALIAANGSGKTTLLRILAGKETHDAGEFSFRNGIRVGFLAQEPDFGTAQSVEEVLLDLDHPKALARQQYEEALKTPEDDEKMQAALQLMEQEKAWDYEAKVQEILTRFNISQLAQSLDILSGGQRKRLALARLLINEPELIILDEPTNHLDMDIIEWLEDYLAESPITLLMVTHDRYFLERVCENILEISDGQGYWHKGNYSYFLEKKAERETLQKSETEKARNLMRKELDWVRRQPKARTGKAKYRLDAFENLKEKAQNNTQTAKLQLSQNMQRLGKKILELRHLHKAYGKQIILADFSYIFKRQERIGIVGANGVGKSTFLQIITQQNQADKGEIETGETIKFGYYRQDGMQLNDGKRVIDIVQDIAEYIDLGKAGKLSAAQLLERFLFSRSAQYKQVATLSGGEKRRLYLLTILIKAPNFLILDEPTNDLDLLTLNVLEDFLMEYEGCLLIVSHDRYFLDKLCDHLFIFEGEGKIRDFNGTYTEYRIAEQSEQVQKEQQKSLQKAPPKIEKKVKTQKKGLSYKEQREYEDLEQAIENLEQEKAQLEAKLNSGELDHEALQNQAEALGEILELIDEKTLRWLELAEKMEA